MTIFLVPDSDTQWITSHSGDSYPRQVVIDLGRPGMRYGIEMRDLIHWTAYRLDTGSQGLITNHRTAAVLRNIAEEFYPYIDDEAGYLAEEIEDAGGECDTDFEDPTVPSVDRRLLGLEDGMAKVDYTFVETLLGDQEPHPILQHNAATTIDFEFPSAAVQKFGIRGIRVCVLDLVGWLTEGAIRSALAFKENQDTWLDELEAAGLRAKAAGHRYRTDRVRWFTERRSTSSSPGVHAPSAAEQDRMLMELSALI